MANLQKEFLKFNESIRLDYDSLDTLRKKRNIVLEKLKDRLREYFDDNNIDLNVPQHFNQGSYAMHTGVNPLKDDYDIDVGLCFEMKHCDNYDAFKVKKWIHEAMKNHTKHVDIKGPCITIQYSLNDEPIYHVDLAVYKEVDSQMYLARGKNAQSSSWEIAKPKALIQKIHNHLSDTSEARKQFLRVVRYLKRWRDIKFSSVGNEQPNGIGLTLCGYDWFMFFDSPPDYGPDDMKALKNLVDVIINNFSLQYHEKEQAFGDRLSVRLFVEPQTDVFDKMTNKHMEAFRSKLEELRDALMEAEEEPDPCVAAIGLVKVLGEDFPIPKREETAEAYKRSIQNSTGYAADSI